MYWIGDWQKVSLYPGLVEEPRTQLLLPKESTRRHLSWIIEGAPSPALDLVTQVRKSVNRWEKGAHWCLTAPPKLENSFKVHALPFTLLYLLDHNAASLKHNICSTNPVGWQTGLEKQLSFLLSDWTEHSKTKLGVIFDIFGLLSDLSFNQEVLPNI